MRWNLGSRCDLALEDVGMCAPSAFRLIVPASTETGKAKCFSGQLFTAAAFLGDFRSLESLDLRFNPRGTFRDISSYGGIPPPTSQDRTVSHPRMTSRIQ